MPDLGEPAPERLPVLFFGIIVIFIASMISIVMVELIDKGWLSETRAIASSSWVYHLPDYIKSSFGR